MFEKRIVDATTAEGEKYTAISQNPCCGSTESLGVYALGSASSHEEEGSAFSLKTGCLEGTMGGSRKMSVGVVMLTLFLSALTLSAVGIVVGCPALCVHCLTGAKVEVGGQGSLASPRSVECVNVFTVDNFSDAQRFGGDIIAFSSALCYCDGDAVKRKRHGGFEESDDGWVMFGSLSEGDSVDFPDGVDILFCLHYGLLSEPVGCGN